MKAEKEQEFLKIVAENQRRIQKVCSMYAQSPEDQKDLVQEVLLNIWKSFGSFRGEAAIGTWIYRIILNVCLKKRYALNSQKSTVSLDTLDIDYLKFSTEVSKDFTALRACIQQLEFADRSIIILFLEELSYKEIGAIVGISENYVAVKIKRIKEKLAICLKNAEG